MSTTSPVKIVDRFRVSMAPPFPVPLWAFGKTRSTRDALTLPVLLRLRAPETEPPPSWARQYIALFILLMGSWLMYTVDSPDPGSETFQGEDIMKSRAPVFLVFLLLTVLAVPAFAAGPYVGVEGGATFLEKAKVTQEGAPDFELKT